MLFFCNAPPAKAGCLRFVAFMTGRRPQRAAYHFAPSHRGTTTKWAVSLASDLESDSSQQPCTLHGKPAYPYSAFICAPPRSSTALAVARRHGVYPISLKQVKAAGLLRALVSSLVR